MTFLFDLGVELSDGRLIFDVETMRGGLKRIVARFHFRRRRQVTVGQDMFSFKAGESIRLFFSYRYTPERVRTLLAGYGLKVLDQWVTGSQEEGVFLCRK